MRTLCLTGSVSTDTFCSLFLLTESVLLTDVLMHAGSYQSLSWGVSAIGGIMSAYFSGSLIQDYGVTFVFGLTAVFPLLTLGAALLIQEQRVIKKEVRCL